MNRAHFLAFAAWLLLAFSFARAEESAVLPGGRSPDGKYEMVIVRADRNPSSYILEIRSMDGGPSLTKSEAVGIMSDPTAKTIRRAWWNPTSDFVVVTDRRTTYSQEIYLFEVSSGSAHRLILPDFVQDAQRQVAATKVYLDKFSQPVTWRGNDLSFVLRFFVDREGSREKGYSCLVTLRVEHEANVRLLSVSTPRAFVD